MDRAKLAIKASVKQWEKYWEVIDRRWEGQLHRHLHAAGLPTNEEGRERDVDSRRKGKASRTISSSSSSDDGDNGGSRWGAALVGAIEELVALVRVLEEMVALGAVMKKSIPWRFRFTGVVPHAKDTALESKSLPSVGNSRKSYLEVTSRRLARGKLVHFHGWKSLALPSVGPGEKWCLRDFADTQEGCEIISQHRAIFTGLRSWLPPLGSQLPSRGMVRESSEGETPYCTKVLRNSRNKRLIPQHFRVIDLQWLQLLQSAPKVAATTVIKNMLYGRFSLLFLLAIRIHSWKVDSKLCPRFLIALLSLDLLW
ncbi:hypothetical protein CK203_034366 [Vitis vinifera]|uniref:Uncharacterized protein n=1 Tax=Vitis vinifera TaxID=29760 RepID=A0A438INV6_VITVI|nr:hypothetical protein CK203_034366 [Vitis vinifera]